MYKKDKDYEDFFSKDIYRKTYLQNQREIILAKLWTHRKGPGACLSLSR